MVAEEKKKRMEDRAIEIFLEDAEAELTEIRRVMDVNVVRRGV